MASLADLLRGYGETALTLGTGTVAQPVGSAYGVYKNITSPYYGTKKGLEIANQEADKVINELTYQPRTEVGQQNLQVLSDLFNKSKLPLAIPELTGIVRTPKASKGVTNETGKGFFDTGDIRRVGLHQSDLNPARLSSDDLRAVQGNIEIPNLRRDITASLDKILANPEINPAVRSAKQINPNFDLQAVRAMPPSSLEKQFPIAKTYEQMVQGIEPTLQAKMFAQYLRLHPEAVRKSGATNYSELVPASYEQLGKENA